MKASFLTSPDHEREQDWEVDISHESLLRQWKTLNVWAEEETQNRDDYLYFSKRADLKGGLLTDADLTLALQWQARQRGEEWAGRYKGDYRGTIALIEKSRQAESRNELQRARRLQAIFAGMACISVLLSFVALFSPETSILLGMQAIGATTRFGIPPVPTAEDSLHHALLESQLRMTLRGHSDSVQSVAFSPDGRRIATGSQDQTAIVWDADTGKKLLTLRDHSDYVSSVAFSPNGKRIATGSGYTAKVWDVETGTELLTLRGFSGLVYNVAYSPDGRHIATGSRGETYKIWDARTRAGKPSMAEHCFPCGFPAQQFERFTNFRQLTSTPKLSYSGLRFRCGIMDHGRG